MRQRRLQSLRSLATLGHVPRHDGIERNAVARASARNEDPWLAGYWGDGCRRRNSHALHGANAFQRSSLSEQSNCAACYSNATTIWESAHPSLSVRQRLLRFSPPRQHLGTCALEQLVGVADGEVVAALVLVELFPGDRR